MSRLPGKQTILISSLCMLCTPAFAQNGSNVKRKIALGPGLAPVAPSVVPKSPAKAAASTVGLGQLKKIAGASYPQTHLQRGLYYKQKGQLNEALIEFIRATEQNPRDVRAFYEQAEIFKQSGKIRLAESAMEQALAVSPGNTQARSYLVQLHVESGNLLGAAAEVGKMFGMNQSPAKTSALSASKSGQNNSRSAMAPSLKETGSAKTLPKGRPGEITRIDNNTIAINSAVFENVLSNGSSNGANNSSSSNLNNSSSSISINTKSASLPGNAASLSSSTATNQLAAAGNTTKHSGLAFSPNEKSNSSAKSVESVMPNSDETSAWLGKAAGNLNEASSTPHNGSEEHQSKENHSSFTISDPLPSPKVTTNENSSTGSKRVVSGSSLADVLAHIGPNSEPKAMPSPTLAKALEAIDPKVAQNATKASSVSATKASPTAASTAKPANQSAQATGLLSRVRNSASRAGHAVTDLTVPDWVKNHLPLASSKNEPAEAAVTEKKDGPALHERAFAAVSWVKERVPFAGQKSTAKTAAPSFTSTSTEAEKESKTKTVVSWVKEKIPFVPHDKETSTNDPSGKITAAWHGIKDQLPAIQQSGTETAASNPSYTIPSATPQPLQKLAHNFKAHVPFVHHDATAAGAGGTSAAPVINTTIVNEDPNDKSELPPEIAKALGNQFNGKQVISTKTTAQQQAGQTAAKTKDKKMEHDIDQVLASLPDTMSTANGAPSRSGPTYALLKNNALSHVSSTDPPEIAEPEPSFLSNVIKQASKSISGIMPSWSWNSLSLPSIPGFSRRSNSPEAVVASVPPPKADAAPTIAVQEQSKSKAPAPIPLNISRILNNLGTPAAPDPKASPASPKLSSSLPLAAAPLNLAEMIPHPQPQALPNSDSSATAPNAVPQALTPNTALPATPQSSPQASPQALPLQVPSVIQTVLEQAQPMIKPVLEAANNVAQAFAPQLIPRSTDSNPEPVKTDWSQTVDNTVPVPVSAKMDKYFPNMAPPPAVGMKAEMLEQASGSAHKLIEVQKSKTGAFTYMKPTFDSDRVFLLGGKQVRTIQPLPAQQAAAKQPEEDAVTKRMRELLKNNSSNLRRGESFMFSEQSGEGTLFMPNGSVERRQLQAGEEAEKLMRKRRPDIMGARDIQYSLELLGKLLPPQNQNNYQQNEPVSGPTLDQLMNQMNQNSKGFFGWMKKSLNINN